MEPDPSLGVYVEGLSFCDSKLESKIRRCTYRSVGCDSSISSLESIWNAFAAPEDGRMQSPDDMVASQDPCRQSNLDAKKCEASLRYPDSCAVGSFGILAETTNGMRRCHFGITPPEVLSPGELRGSVCSRE